eukprot:5850290-Pyramimonas_sp.AAC.1
MLLKRWERRSPQEAPQLQQASKTGRMLRYGRRLRTASTSAQLKSRAAHTCPCTKQAICKYSQPKGRGKSSQLSGRDKLQG